MPTPEVTTKEVLAEMRQRDPVWTEAALQRARLKKAGGTPLAALPPWRRARLERQAQASVFALILQGDRLADRANAVPYINRCS